MTQYRGFKVRVDDVASNLCRTNNITVQRVNIMFNPSLPTNANGRRLRRRKQITSPVIPRAAAAPQRKPTQRLERRTNQRNSARPQSKQKRRQLQGS